MEFEDDWETVSPSAGLGTRLLRQELHNHTQGLPPGLTAMPSSNTGQPYQPHPTSTHLTPFHHTPPHRTPPCLTLPRPAPLHSIPPH